MTSNKVGSGSLRAVAEPKSERHPSYKGSLTIRGEKFWLSGWKRVDEATGESWLSLSAEVAQLGQPAEQPAKPVAQPAARPAATPAQGGPAPARPFKYGERF